MQWEYLETIYYPATEPGKRPGWYEHDGHDDRRITGDTNDLLYSLGLLGWVKTGSGNDLVGNEVLIFKREVQS